EDSRHFIVMEYIDGVTLRQYMTEKQIKLSESLDIITQVASALSVQQEISRDISDRLAGKLTGEEQKQLAKRETTNPEAYQSYLKGRYFWNKRTKDDLKKAIEEFQQAVDKDPSYALAYVGLADCYAMLEEYEGRPASEIYQT